MKRNLTVLAVRMFSLVTVANCMTAAILADPPAGWEAQPAPRHGETRMIRIPAGTYEVGSTPQQREALGNRYGMHPSMLNDELPARHAQVKEFFIDAYPVTNAQYAAFIAATGAAEPYDWRLHATAARADHPVIGVGGNEAEAYARWVGKRLPTPQQWEAAFAGLPAQKDRAVPGGQWSPITYPAATDPGPRSGRGLHGFGQVCEWTSQIDTTGRYPFRLLKGGSWFCQESWSLRPAAAFYAFAPWCRQWTGLRCVADKPIDSVPESPLPQVGAADYHKNRGADGGGVRLLYRGGRGMAVAFSHVGEALGMAAPEGCLVNGGELKAGDWEDLYSSGAASGATGKVMYRFRTRQIHTEVRFRAGADFFDMDYAYRNLSDTEATIQTSTCMNAGLMDAFYDLEGSRTFIWLGRGDWLPVRSLPRGEKHVRWISAVVLPQPAPQAVLVAVLGNSAPMVFAYGRVGLVRPMAMANNFCFSCLHLDPVVPVPAGGEALTQARIYCVKGGLEDIRRRFIADFGLAGE